MQDDSSHGAPHRLWMLVPLAISAGTAGSGRPATTLRRGREGEVYGGGRSRALIPRALEAGRRTRLPRESSESTSEQLSLRPGLAQRRLSTGPPPRQEGTPRAS